MKIAFSFFFVFFFPLYNLAFPDYAEAFSIDSVNSAVDIVSHAFVQTGAELHYFSDTSHQEIILAGGPNDLTDAKISNEPLIEFTPNELDFNDGVVGIPISKSVVLKNPTSNKIRFSAISSTSIEFHCTFLQNKVIDSIETTSFDVIFLPRNDGHTESTLYIHSSLGIFPYKVKGNGRTNPYRMRPITAVQIPLNSTFISPVQVHNPHASVLQVKEMYVSGADVHLDLPNESVFSKSERKALWEISPYETKTIANAKILARHEQNTTAYIGLKVALKETKWPVAREFFEQDTKPPDILVLPLDLQISKKRGIFSSESILDFGLIKAGDKSKQLIFRIFSTVDKSLDIESIYVEKSNDYAHGIYMEFAAKPPIGVKSGIKGQPGPPVALAKISIDSNYVLKNAQEKQPSRSGPQLLHCEGRIIAESRGGNYNVSVPYKAVIYSGELLHNPEAVSFHHQIHPPVQRGIRLTNSFPFGITVINVSIAENGKDYFKVDLVTPQVRIGKAESMPVLLLKYLKQQKVGFSTSCRIMTNVSNFDIPIIIFNGRLKITLYSLAQNIIDFGDVQPNERRSILFAITNDNPVPITINKLQHPLPTMTTLEFMGLEPGNDTVLSGIGPKLPIFWTPGDDFSLPGRSFAVFNYTLIAPKKEDIENRALEDFVLKTNFDTYTFPLHFRLTNSTVFSVPRILSFGKTFPGKITSRKLRMYSTFEEDLYTIRLSSLSSDHRLFFQSAGSAPPIIHKEYVSEIGRALFMPEATCPNDCYVGVPLHTSDGQWFSYGLKLPANLAEIDSYLYRRLRRKWENLVAANRHQINTTIVVDTTHVKNFEVQANAELVWPKLLSHSVVHFPLTAVGNFTIVNLTLTNPTTKSIIVQLLPLVIYPDADAMLEFFRDDFPAPLTEPVEMNETLIFSLRDTELFTLKPGSPVPKLREQLEAVLGSSVPRFTLSMLLQPGMKVRIRVGFLPTDYNLHSSLLLIRNNLTIIEPVVLYGRGSRVDVQIDNKTSRAEPLLFEIQTNHLADCNNPKRQRHKLTTTLTVKRSFMVKNTGEVSFTVVNMSINNHPCENRGFKILNCMPFRLEPNETYFIDVAYTPDFLMAVNEAALQLYMHMNGTPWVFFMGATLPRHMLGLCHAALPRPPFEIIMRYLCLTALLFCLICVIACSYLEGDRMITCAIRQQHTQERAVFDLNAIVVSVNQGNSLQKPNKNPETKSLNLDTKRRKTHCVTIEPDASLFNRGFWMSINWVLWLVSPVWVAVRSDPATNQTKSKRKKQKRSVTNALVEQTSPGQTFMHIEPNVIKSDQQCMSSNLTGFSHINGVSVQNSESNNIMIKNENKEHHLPLNNTHKPIVSLSSGDNKMKEENLLTNKQEVETELRLRKTLKTMDENIELPMFTKKPNHIKQDNNLHLDKNGAAKKKRERRTSKPESDGKSDRSEKFFGKQVLSQKSKENLNFTSIDNSYSRHSSNVSGTDFEEPHIRRSLPLPTDEDEEEPIEPANLSDPSEIPEWADDGEIPIAEDVEELYDELVTTSAVFFSHSRDSSPAAASSLSHSPKENTFIEPTLPSKKSNKKETSDGTDNSKASMDLSKKRKKRHQFRLQKNENSEIIAKLMKQYHEYLQDALASGKKPEDLLPPKLPLNLPDDLSANGFDPKFDWDNMKQSDLENSGKASPWPLNPSTSYDEENLETREKSDHSPNLNYSHFGSLFPATDPIWKPIIEEDEMTNLWSGLRTKKAKNE